jgi:hypothetical protein
MRKLAIALNVLPLALVAFVGLIGEFAPSHSGQFPVELLAVLAPFAITALAFSFPLLRWLNILASIPNALLLAFGAIAVVLLPVNLKQYDQTHIFSVALMFAIGLANSVALRALRKAAPESSVLGP